MTMSFVNASLPEKEDEKGEEREEQCWFVPFLAEEDSRENTTTYFKIFIIIF